VRVLSLLIAKKGLYRYVIHPPLFDFSLFFIVFGLYFVLFNKFWF